MKSLSELTAEARQSLVATSIAELIQLNNDHFDGDKGIRQALDDLSDTLLHEPDLSKIWQKFLSFADAPGNNFGTWCI
jgi:hypothetical protein